MRFFFAIYDSNEKKTNKRFSIGINEKPEPEREAQAKALAAVLWEALNKGWNPFKEKFPTWERKDVNLPMSFSTALDYALQKKKPFLSKYSLYDYEGCVRFMKSRVGFR